MSKEAYPHKENVVCIHSQSVQLLSHAWLFATPWTTAPQASLIAALLELAQIHVHWVGDAIQPSHPLLSPSPPAFNLSQHLGLFQWVSSSIRWPKYWSFSFSISPFKEYSGLISFRMDWLDLLAEERLSRVFSNTTVQKHQFFGTQLSCTSVHDYWKNHSFDYTNLCRQSNVSVF